VIYLDEQNEEFQREDQGERKPLGAAFDTGSVRYDDASGKFIFRDADGITMNGVIVPQFQVLSVPGLDANATSQLVLVAHEAIQITGVKESHGTASASGTLQVEKLTGTTAAGSGTAMLSWTISLAGTANTLVSGTLSGTTANLQLAAGDRLGFKFAGTMTNLADCSVTVQYKRI
jgi:hypothetical protein